MGYSKDIIVDISELIQDDHNFNKGTEHGAELLEKSFKKFGAGRSVLVDKNNRLIAGNKSAVAAENAGITKARIIETEGDELVVVKRKDIDLDSSEGRELAFVDNQTTITNVVWDEIELDEISNKVDFDPTDWGYNIGEISDDENPAVPKERTENYNITYSIVFNDEDEQDRWFEFLQMLKNKYPDTETISERIVKYINSVL